MAIDEQEVLEILQNVGAFRSGHFVFTSGRHGDSYVNKDALYTHTHDLSRLCRAIVDRLTHRTTIIETGTKSIRLEDAKRRSARGKA